MRYGEVLEDKSAMYIRVALYLNVRDYIETTSFGYMLYCGCFNFYCGCFNLFCNVWVCVCVCVCLGFL